MQHVLKLRKEGKPRGKNLPSKYNVIKRKEEKKQLLSNYVLHSKTITQRAKLLLSECLGEDVCSLFG